MHQPPTIPEGDEENEGVEQMGEGVHASSASSQVQQHITSAHDSVGASSEPQVRETEAAANEDTPALQNDATVFGEDISADETQAELDQTSSAEKPAGDDEDGIPHPPDTENEPSEQVSGQEGLSGIQEESGAEGSEAVPEGEGGTSMPTIPGSPVPPAEDSSLAVPHGLLRDDHAKHDDISASFDERRRSAKSQRETPQVEFEKVEQEEEQDVVHEEPEVRISREELLARHQAAEAERDRLKSINLALQQRLADYLHKRKGTDEIPALSQGNERLMLDQQQRYQKYLGEIEALQEQIKRDQLDYEDRKSTYEQQIQRKQEYVDKLKADYVKLVKDIASKAVFSRSGKSISNQEIESYLTALKEKEEELIKTRHDNIRLKNQLRKRELQLKAKEELAEGLHMIDFEQLKIENQTYSEKIEERNEELTKLRKKISQTVQILSHIKEKLHFVDNQRTQASQELQMKEQEVKQKRDELATIKRRRDRLRQDNQSLKQTSGLIGNEQLLRDYEDRYDEIGLCTEKLENLKKRHAEITLMCRVLKKKISKV